MCPLSRSFTITDRLTPPSSIQYDNVEEEYLLKATSKSIIQGKHNPLTSTTKIKARTIAQHQFAA